MVGVEQHGVQDFHPTPDFQQQCLEVKLAWTRGDISLKEAVAHLKEMADQASAAGHLANEGEAQLTLGYIQHYRGNLDASINFYEQAYRCFAKVNNLEKIAQIDLNQGENYRLKGEAKAALRLYRSAFSNAQKLGHLIVQTLAALNEGLMLISTSQLTLGQRRLEAALHLTSQWEQQDRLLEGIMIEIHCGLATIHLSQNNPGIAFEQAYKAVTIANSNVEPLNLGFAYRIMGEAIAQIDKVPDGFEPDPDHYYKIALDAFEEINAEAEVARTVFAQALTLAARGHRTTAARKLRHVMVMFTKLGMHGEAARAAEAQGKLL